MLNNYFDGKELYGDNFDQQAIKNWFDHEAEAYANLSVNNPIVEAKDKSYTYHVLNEFLGFDHIQLKDNLSALGIGAAYGAEFIPIKKHLKEIHILEPSDQLIAEKLDDIPLIYSKPDISGKMPYQDNQFDVITCFGTLHHIPNVSFVVSELARVLKPGGYLLIREPIISMGDWNQPRKGLTKFERGIPLPLFRNMFKNSKLKIVKESPCFTLLFVFQRILKRQLHESKMYLNLDRILSKLFLPNYTYHATSKLKRIAPTNVFYILSK
jgi:SAM-dependent methyltransferase